MADNNVENDTEKQESLDSWTEEEKSILLRGLKEYGYKEIDNITDLLPTKSKKEIEQKMNKLMVQAHIRINEDILVEPINFWLKLYPATETAIPEALLYISRFEKHPKSKYNFKSIYMNLYRTMLGKPPKNLSENSRDLLYKLFTEEVMGKPRLSRQQVLNTVSHEYSWKDKTNLRVYSNKKKS